MADMQHKWKTLGALVAAVVAGVFAIEGGYVNDPNDAGGATNHGITEQVARQHGYTGPMQSLPKGMAQDIYISSYIVKPGFDRVLQLSPAVGTKLVDAGVNAGPGRASRWLQQSLNDLSRAGRDYPPIKVDGAIGRDTLSAYAALEKRRARESLRADLEAAGRLPDRTLRTAGPGPGQCQFHRRLVGSPRGQRARKPVHRVCAGGLSMHPALYLAPAIYWQIFWEPWLCLYDYKP